MIYVGFAKLSVTRIKAQRRAAADRSRRKNDVRIHYREKYFPT